MNNTEVGKFISLILRHKPETIGIILDKHGWADVDELVRGVSKKFKGFDNTSLVEIVLNNDKQRYSFNDDRTKIRANQGHSINVDVELKKQKPPIWLYHGTGLKYVNSIDKEGLKPKSRLYVHLSGDKTTAKAVGKRHGELACYIVAAEAMHRDGYEFYLSENGVWLTKEVPNEYLLRVLPF